MMEVLIPLVILVVVAFLVIALGHGLWLLGAAILRALFSVGQADPDRSSRCCGCGALSSIKQGVCALCGYRTIARQRDDVFQAMRLISRLHVGGEIQDDEFRRVTRALQSMAHKLPTADGVDQRLRTAPEASLPPPAPPVPAPRVPVSPPPATRPVPPPLPHKVSAAAMSQGVMDAEVVDAEIVFQPTADNATPLATVVHPLDAPEPESSRTVGTPGRFSPRRTMADMLQSFMEEKNIRWGELASGILIVGSAIGLVISLRAKLAEISQQIQYFPALLFMLGTVAIHAAGLYTLKRWKLRSTSRGVLIIATLLVPLSFAAGIVMGGAGEHRTPVTSPLYIAAVLTGLLGYGVITTFSAKALFPEGWWRLTVAVIGTSAGQMVINRLADVETSRPWLVATALFALPLASFMVAGLAQLRVVALRPRLTPVRATQTYVVLGVAAFSLAVPLGLQAWVSGAVRETLTWLSPSLSLAAAAVLSLGIAIQNRSTARPMAETRTVGTALAILGGMLMIGTLVLAWPAPPLLVAVSMVTAGALFSLAILGRIPLLHAGGVAAASLGGLLLFHHFRGQFPADAALTGQELIEVLVMGRSALVLLVPTILSATVGLVCLTRSRSEEGNVYLASGLGLAGGSLAIALYAGFWTGVDANWTTLLFIAYAATALAVCPQIRREWATAVGAALTLIAIIHLFRVNHWFAQWLASWNIGLTRPILVSFLAHGLILELYGLGLLLWSQWRGTSADLPSSSELRTQVLQPVAAIGVTAAALTVPFVLVPAPSGLGTHAVYAACIATVWALAAGISRDARLVTATQAALTVAIGFSTAACAARQSWSIEPLRDLRHWQWQLAVLSGWCAVLTLTRFVSRRWPRFHQLVQPPWPTVDLVLMTGILAGLAVVGMTACRIGALCELGWVAPGSPLMTDAWHTIAWQAGSWIAWGCAMIALGLLLTERTTTYRLSGMVIATAIAPLLWAGRFEPQLSVASALRWSFAIYTIVWTALLAARKPIEHWWSIRPLADSDREVHLLQIRRLALSLGMAPVIVLTTLAFGQALQQTPLHGPLPGTFFGTMTETILYGLPFGLLVISALVMAARDGSAPLALLGSLLLQYFIAMAVVIPALDQTGVVRTEVYVALVQWTTCGLGGYLLVWLGLNRWIDRPRSALGSQLLDLQAVAASASALTLFGWSLAEIFVDPDRVGAMVKYLGQWPSYLAVAIVVPALGYQLAFYHRHTRRYLGPLAVAVACGLLSLAAASANTYDPPVEWIAYHVVTAGWLGAALIAVGIASWRTLRKDGSPWVGYLSGSATIVALLVCVLLVRGCAEDPIAPAWTGAIAAGLFTFFTAQALRRRKQLYAYLSLLTLLFATSVMWFHLAPVHDEQFAFGLLFVNVLAASVVGLWWFAVDLWHQHRHATEMDEQFPLARVHLFAAMASLIVMMLFGIGGTGLSTAIALTGGPDGLRVTSPWGVGALVAWGLLLSAMCWDRRIGVSLVASYLWGYVLIALIVNQCEQLRFWSAEGSIVAGCLLSAAYVALTGHIWRWGANLAQWSTRVAIPDPIGRLENVSRWLPTCNVVATLIVSGLGFITVFVAEERAMRMSVAFAPLMLAYGVGCLAQQHRRIAMQSLSLFLIVVAAVFIGWADVARSSGDSAVLAYTARLLVVLAAMTLIYNLVLARWLGSPNDWYQPLRRTSGVLAVLTVANLALVLGLEAVEFRPGVGAPIGTAEVIAISVMLAGFIVALLCMAILPGRDPLSLSEKGRELYVYAAQLIAATLCAHIYLAEPELFSLGIFKQYWPYIVMGIAFISVSIGEFCHRRGWQVIAEPMQRTGGFLPILPALTAMAFSQSNYPLVLFFAGLIYVFMSVTRRSFVAGIAAAVMGNGALWALLTDHGFQLTAQPQFWMIPPALSVLVAAYWNRDRLSDSSLTAIRYICVMIIYLSSTGEMFMRLLVPAGSEDWLRPIILTSLSLAGIFAGILLRVRAFLYLGASFLLLSIVTMVWNAGRVLHHTWPWWVFGISVGLVILVIFGLFEKHRREVEQLVTRLRQWEP